MNRNETGLLHPSSLELARLRTYPQHTRTWLPLLRSRPGGVHRRYVVRSPKSDNFSKHFQISIAHCQFVSAVLAQLLHLEKQKPFLRKQSQIGNQQSEMSLNLRLAMGHQAQ